MATSLGIDTTEGLILEIVSPDRRVLAPVQVQSVTLPGLAGEMTVLPGHARLVSLLGTGALRYVDQGGVEHSAALSSGFVEVEADKVSVMAETLELAKEVDVERAKRAQMKAEERLKERELSPEEFNKYQLKLQRALLRQQVHIGL